MSKSATMTPPNVYAVTGSINPSRFTFSQGTLQEVLALFNRKEGVSAFSRLAPVLLQKNCGYSGTISHDMKEPDFKKAVMAGNSEKNPSNPNPGTRDGAWLSPDNDTLVVKGTIKLINNFSTPAITDSVEYGDWQKSLVAKYISENGLNTLIGAYLKNLVEQRVLWRNQYGFSKRTVIGLKYEDTTKDFYLTKAAGPEFDDLVETISKVLSETNGYLWLEVAMCVELGAGAEVFPSQPFIDATGKKEARGDNYGRILASIEIDRTTHQVILSPQKIGNALRRIDSWYTEGSPEPIAAEVYGVVPTMRTVHRTKGKNSFYDFFGKPYESIPEEQRHYVMAMLIKGGVFGVKGD